jgi:hypothetical protein
MKAAIMWTLIALVIAFLTTVIYFGVEVSHESETYVRVGGKEWRRSK